MIQMRHYFSPLAIPVIEKFYKLHHKHETLARFTHCLDQKVDFRISILATSPLGLPMINGLFSSAKIAIEDATNGQTEWCYVDDAGGWVEFVYPDEQLDHFAYSRRPLILRESHGVTIWAYEVEKEHAHILLLKSENKSLLNWKKIRAILDELNCEYPSLTGTAASKPDSLVGRGSEQDWRFEKSGGVSGLQNYWQKLGCKLGADGKMYRGREPSGWKELKAKKGPTLMNLSMSAYFGG